MTRTRPIRHQPIADGLRSLPYQWAKVGNYRWLNSAKGTVHCIHTGVLPAYQPAGCFEAEIRLDSEGDAHVYARYVGPQEVVS
jgi:hypothetical protein